MIMANRLSIVIPAYNEEDAIASVVQGVRDASPLICRETQVDDVEIIVVNDGSRDRTAEIVRSFPDVVLVEHPTNRGYGAALKTGFARATGELLGFLDGDGTCDARDFVPLCRGLDGADLVLGTRLAAKSRMPLVRRIGNRIFAALAMVLSGKAVTDIATGMRVFRREVLEQLPALPDGLHYTPAMSCHALYLSDVRVAEQEISYAERVGDSKLSVVQDGLRFLRIIVDSALVYFPMKVLGAVSVAFFLLGVGYGLEPVLHYARHRALEEDMIYRLLAIVVFETVAMTFLLVGIVAQNLTFRVRGGPARSAALRVISSPNFQYLLFGAGLLAALAGVALNAGNVLEYMRDGRISSHWSYVLLGGLLVVMGALAFALGALTRMTALLTTPAAGHRGQR